MLNVARWHEINAMSYDERLALANKLRLGGVETAITLPVVLMAREGAIAAEEVAALKAAFANWPADGIVRVGVYVNDKVTA